MTDNEIIALQAKEIYSLREKVRLHKEDKLSIHYTVFGIGGPLNDNKLQYTLEQLAPFARIGNHLDNYEDEE